VVVFAGMLASVNQMLYGEAPEKIERGDVIKWSLVPLAINLCLLVILGLTLPRPFAQALEQALKTLGV
jgi:hypothetical protein